MLWFRLVSLLVAVFLAVPCQAAGFRLLRLDGYFVKWGEARLGTGAVVTWSFTDRRREFADAINCRVIEPLDPVARAAGTTTDEVRAVFGAAFALWQEVADVSFIHVSDNDAADILIGAQGESRNVAFANVWHQPRPGTSVAQLSRATICLNPEAPWETDRDGNDETYQIGQVAAHEIGHTLGLDHPGRRGALMGYKYEEESDVLQPGDVTGAVTLYGASPANAMPSDRPVGD